MKDDARAGGVIFPFLIVSLIWGSTWIVIRDQLADIPAQWSVCFRFLIAAAGMAALARLRGYRFAVDRRAMVFAVALGVAQFTLNFNFVYAAEAYVTSGLVALVYALLLVPNSLLSWRVFGHQVTARFVGGSMLAIAGVALLFVQEWRSAPLASAGNVTMGLGFALAGVLTASVANVMQSAQTARRVPMEVMLTYAMLIGALIDAAIAYAMHGLPSLPTRAGYWAGAVYLGIFGSVVTFPLYFRLIQQIGAGKAAYTSVLIPVIAMAISTAVESYRWTPIAAAGAALSLVGLILALQSRKPST